MPCNNKKNFANLVSKKRIQVFRTRHFFDAYLWRDAQAMRENLVDVDPDSNLKTAPSTEDMDGDLGAFVCYMPFTETVGFSKWWHAQMWLHGPQFLKNFWVAAKTRQYRPKLGEMHFYTGPHLSWSLVSHEASHAAIAASRALGIAPHAVFAQQGQCSEFLANPHTVGLPSPANCDEEAFCYIQENIFAQVSEWILEVDTIKLNKGLHTHHD